MTRGIQALMIGIGVLSFAVCAGVDEGHAADGATSSRVVALGEAGPGVIESGLKEVLEKKFLGMSVKAVTKTEVPGWYLVETDTGSPDGIMYIHEGGRYVLSGGLFDIAVGRNLTQEYVSDRQARILASLNRGQLLVLNPTSPRVKDPVLIFDDPDCPVCRRMHPEVKQLVDAGVPVGVVLFPLMRPHPDAYRKSVAIWCSSDRASALEQVLLGSPIESPVQSCDHPVDANLKLAKQLGVNQTPIVFLPNGRRIEGFHKAADILAALNLPSTHTSDEK